MRSILIFFTLISLSSIGLAQSNNVTPFFAELLADFPSVRDLTMTADGSEAYFTAQPLLGELAVIMVITKNRWGWKKPRIASFSGAFSDLEPFLTADGLRLYFCSDRPLDPLSNETKDYDIWYVERNSRTSDWSSPINLGAPVNSGDNEFYPSLASSGNLYFTSNQTGTLGEDDIFFSMLGADGYTPPVSLGDSINTTGYDFNAFVAPDESYLIYTLYNFPGGLGSGDLYISFRDDTGIWSAARNLGPQINSKQMDYCPFVLNGSLYFTSKRSDMTPQVGGFQDLKDLLQELNKSENGQSRLYSVSADLFLQGLN